MAQKTVKKATAKPAAKKAPIKKVAAKKPVAKKAAVKEAKMATPIVETHACGCGADCHCCAGCKCSASRFGRFVRKLVVFLIIFALGWFAASFVHENEGRHHQGPRMHFVNGCLDVASVKCPKMQAALPAMDINQDGCITRDEFRQVKRNMRAEIREMPVQEVETPSTPDMEQE